MLKLPDAKIIQNAFSQSDYDIAIHAFGELASTSVWLRDSMDTLLSNTTSEEKLFSTHHLCVTDWQSSGIARRGRQWETKPGNITFSVLSLTDKPANQLLGLSLVTGIGVATALDNQLGLQVRLKWPNDVLVKNSKLGGLLTEIKRVNKAQNHSKNANAILTGIGINVLHDQEVLSLGIGATSLQDEGITVSADQRDQLIGVIARCVIDAHARFLDQGWQVFIKDWDSLDYLRNKRVSIDGEAVTGMARVLGVSHEGALIVEQNGQTIPLYSGNVSVRPN